MLKKLLGMKKLLVAAVLVLSVATIGVVQLNASAKEVRDCDSNAIMYCGAFSAAEFLQKYGQNKTGDLGQIYAHYGIDVNQIASAKHGMAMRDGRVIVDGKTVATNGYSLGRHGGNGRSPVSIAGKTYYDSPSSTVFQSDIPAFVFFDANGKFAGAILKSCGNPLKANPTPVPAASCDSLVAKAITRQKYRFTATASTRDGANIVAWRFIAKDSAGTEVFNMVAPAEQNYTDIHFEKPGTYTVQVIVGTSLGERTGQQCVTQITVAPEAPKPSAICKSLTAKIQNRTEYTLTGQAAVANGATISGYSYVIKDEAGKIVVKKDIESTATTSSISGSLKSGTYKALVAVKTSLGYISSPNCETELAVERENCVVPGKEHLPKDSPLCRENCIVPGKENLPKDSPDCYENCTVPGKEHLPKNSPECKEVPPVTPPETPTELPTTGVGTGASAIAGIGSIVGASFYYVASRRHLLDAFLSR